MLVKTKNKDGILVEAKLTAFSFWECGKIGININDLTTSGLIGGFDLSVEEANRLAWELLHAINIYQGLEETIEQHDAIVYVNQIDETKV
jgi:hypothetical protein